MSELVRVVKECFDTKDTHYKYVSFHPILLQFTSTVVNPLF